MVLTNENHGHILPLSFVMVLKNDSNLLAERVNPQRMNLLA